MVKRTIIVLGGSGGIGSKLTDIFRLSYNVIPMSSKDCDVTGYSNIVRSGVDYVVNCACFNYDNVIHKSSDVHVRKMINVNCFGAVNVLREYIKYFREQKKPGKIVMMSSFLSTRPEKGTGVYSASKAFINQAVTVAALENAGHGILINSVNAGYFNAGLTDRLPAGMKESLPNIIPVGRIGSVEELAHAIQFLLNNDYVTGTNLVIDGGMSLL